MRSFTHQQFTWLDYPKPEERELRVLQQKYNFHDLDIEDCLSEHERPKIEEYDNYLFLVFHIPYLAKGTDRIRKVEVNIFLGQDYIITVHSDEIPVIDELGKQVTDSQSRLDELFRQGTGFFLYELVEELFDDGFPILDRIRKKLRSLETELFDSDAEVDILREIMSLKHNIITMRSILLPQRSLIAMLEHKHSKFISEELGIYFGDVLDAIERQWSLLETAKELCEALEDTYESILRHKSNTVIVLLTIFSVTMLPLTFITNLYGMNVPLPLQEHPMSFFLLLGLMATILVGTIGYFVWKKWL
ncbi:MAG: magnesium transporter CorA family protein [Candidatus Peregrinibacteria bacterium]|nr:magnesium transporter CorA family protein [Candidatus Peregrinibacteria bacterium]